MEKTDVLKQCTVEGNVVKLPGIQLDRKLYMEVAKALELIGGKWKGHKTAGFVFADDPTDLLAEIASGKTRNLKKEYQYFSTPEIVAEVMIQKAEIIPEVSIMEPSAGSGALLDCILKFHPESTVFFTEKMPTNAIQLNKKFDKHPRLFFLHPPEDDFLQLESGEVFDRIIANPPFAKNQDIEHINKMYRILKPGGIIVTLASNHWKTSTNARETEFRTWIEYINAEITDLPAGTFKESGTEIATCMLKIKKPPLRMIR